jgi:hypothetical protein
MNDPETPKKPNPLHYAMPSKPPPRKGYFYTIVWAAVGIVGGYFVCAGIGVLLGGNEGPVPFLCLLWPVIIVGLALWGHRMDQDPY